MLNYASLIFVEQLTIWSVTRDEVIHRSRTLPAGETFLVVDVTHRNHLLSLENLETISQIVLVNFTARLYDKARYWTIQ